MTRRHWLLLLLLLSLQALLIFAIPLQASIRAAVSRPAYSSIATTPDLPVSVDADSYEEWFYGLLNALSDPQHIRVSLAGGNNADKWELGERAYLKDFDDLSLDGSHDYVTGGLTFGHILSLPPGTYYHYGNSGVLFVTESDVAARRQSNAKGLFFRRLKYLLEIDPDQEIHFSTTGGRNTAVRDLEVGERGSVLSFAASGGGFVTANLYLDSGNGNRTVNGMGLGVYSPRLETLSYYGNLHTTALSVVPLPKRDGLSVRLFISHTGEGHSYFRVHKIPEWW